MSTLEKLGFTEGRLVGCEWRATIYTMFPPVVALRRSRVGTGTANLLLLLDSSLRVDAR